jgi:hypothetical protein
MEHAICMTHDDDFYDKSDFELMTSIMVYVLIGPNEGPSPPRVGRVCDYE